MNQPQVPGDIDELAAQRLDGEDSAILTAIAAVFERQDPMPEGLVERLTFGLSLAEMEAELAELQSLDSGLVTARSEDAEQARSITYASDSLTVMISIGALTAGRVRIDGWVAPAQVTRVELKLQSGTLETDTDADGRFAFDDVESGLAQFVLRAQTDGAPARPVITPVTQL